MTIKIIVNGAKGNMGQQAAKAIQQDPSLKLIAECDKEDNLATIIQNTKADVVVDFTHVGVAYDNVETIIQHGARPVIGTTGFTEDQIKKLQQHCKQLKRGGIIAPNFSIGAILMMRFAIDAARYFSDVEIIEMHHERKLDAPSGTAVKTAQMISEIIPNKQPTNANEHEVIKGARGATINNIPIHAIRLPGLLAHQKVMFGGLGETLSIHHDTINRECFMPGVLLSCKKVMELKELVYGLENIIT